MSFGDRRSIRRVASEFGQFFDEWVRKKPAGLGWSEPLRDLDNAASISWTNLTGTIAGTAGFYEPLSNFALSSPSGYENEHTVHVGVRQTNSVGYSEIGPATALHDPGVGVIDDGYVVIIGNSGGVLPFIALYKLGLGGGSFVLLAVNTTPADATVCDGAVVSLGYRWNTSAGAAELSVLVNGRQILSHTDASGYNIGTVTDGRFGLYGDIFFPITTTIGHLLQEWWVTDGFGTYERPASIYPSLNRGLRISVMQRKRYTISTDPKIKALLGGQVSRCRWSYKRIGGCASLSAVFRYTDDDDPVAESFRGPTESDWDGVQWLGGDVVLSIPHTALELDESQSATNEVNSVWRGRLTKIRISRETREVRIDAEGLFANLREQIIESADYDSTIRLIIDDLIATTAKSGSSGALYGYDASKIIGTNSALDLNLAISFRGQSLKAALDKLTAYLPKGVVWGVDKDGDFFLDQQSDPYVVDHVGSGALSFDATGGNRFELSAELGKIATEVLVLGKEDEGEGTTTATSSAGRVSGRAASDRSAAIFGDRKVVHSDSSIREAGLAFKMALARAKSFAGPRLTATFETTHPLQGLRALYQSLTIRSPKVLVRTENAAKDEARELRYYDDGAAYSMKEEGSSGAIVTIPSVAAEQALSNSFLLHVALKFDLPHPGTAGQSAFIFGRPGDARTAPSYGWGSLWWAEAGAASYLFWTFTDAAGSLHAINTGITVDSAGLGDVVHLTIYRDSAGDFFFYNGNTQTATYASAPNALYTTDTGPWSFFNNPNGGLPAGFIDGDVSVRHFWVFDATAIEALETTATSPVLDFIARNNGGALHRNDAYGLLLYFPFREQGSTEDYTGFRAASPPVAVTATVTNSGQSGTPDGDDFDNGKEGVVLGTEKKWGGPYVFDAESVSYDYDARAGLLTRRYTLGDVPLDGYATIAALEDQVEKFGDLFKRISIPS